MVPDRGGDLLRFVIVEDVKMMKRDPQRWKDAPPVFFRVIVEDLRDP
jgi:hypothetical protein